MFHMEGGGWILPTKLCITCPALCRNPSTYDFSSTERTYDIIEPWDHLLVGGHSDPPTNSKTKDDTRTNFFAQIIVCHISTKNQQLDFSNFHCSIVCSYCSIWCLIIKSGSKMVQISNASYENEIQMVDSPCV